MISSSLRLCAPWSDHAVVQRDMPLCLAGRDHPHQPLRVLFRGEETHGCADGEGRWRVTLRPGPAGGPFTLRVIGSSEVIVRDVLVGDVWLASGQSNMEWRLNQCPCAAEESRDADFRDIRFFTVPAVADPSPQDDLSSSWKTVTPLSALDMSAVAFFFARHLHIHLGTPIGVIISAWGGTPAETWLPRDGFTQNATVRKVFDAYTDTADDLDNICREAAKRISDWEATHMPADPGNEGVASGWADVAFDDSAWPTMLLPGFWQSLPGMDFNGIVWFRRTIPVPSDWRGQPITLELGAVDDYDDTYVNGVRVGGLGKDVPEAYQQKRIYRVPASCTSGEEITVAVRVFDHFGLGGFRSGPDDMFLLGPDNGRIPLHGEWRYRAEHRLPPPSPDLFNTRPYLPAGVLPKDRPSHAYHGMIHPLRDTTFKGVLWYQGESNGGRAIEYADIFRALIESWRSIFRNAGLPFLFVQLPNFRAGADWPELREAQAQALSLPFTGMAVTLDVGDAVDIHPTNKKPVGERLAAEALRVAYGVADAPTSPAACRASMDGADLIIHFRDAPGGLTTTDGAAPRCFELRGPDGAYAPAEARVEGESVRVHHASIPKPSGVRYAFAPNPDVNLTNRTGQPAAPFRMDSVPS